MWCNTKLEWQNKKKTLVCCVIVAKLCNRRVCIALLSVCGLWLWSFLYTLFCPYSSLITFPSRSTYHRQNVLPALYCSPFILSSKYNCRFGCYVQGRIFILFLGRPPMAGILSLFREGLTCTDHCFFPSIFSIIFISKIPVLLPLIEMAIFKFPLIGLAVRLSWRGLFLLRCRRTAHNLPVSDRWHGGSR